MKKLATNLNIKIKTKINRLKQRIKYIIIKFIQFFFNNKEKQCDKFNKSQINKILVFRLDEIGDVVMTTPFIRELRRNFPKANITLIVKPQTYNLVELCPYVDKILTFNRYAGRFSFFINIFKAYSFSKKFLQKEKFGLCIIPRWDTDVYGASYLAYFSKAKRRVAYSECISAIKSIENKGFDGFFTDVITKTEHLHEVERNLDVIRFLNRTIVNDKLEIWDDKGKSEVFNKENTKTLKFVVVTSTSSELKEWNINNYIDVINRITGRFLVDVILLGSGERAQRQADILEKNCCIKCNLVNKTTLRESLSILKQSDLYLGGDTGPTHLAAVAGLKGIALYADNYNGNNYGYNCPERFGPWKSNIVVLCPPKGKKGVDEISVEQVYNNLEEICLETINEKDEGSGGVDTNCSLELWFDLSDREFAKKIINIEYINIIFTPSAGSKRREWDIDKYCEVLNLLNKKFDFKLIVLGDIKNTSKVLQNLKEKHSGEVIDLVGKTTLRETVALMKRADVFIGGDTGPMHIAAACKIDGVVVSCHPKNGDIHHGNSPKRFGPWQSPLVVLQPEQGLDDCRDGCNKNYAHCINQITVEKVYRELEQILEKKVKENSGGKQ